MIQSMQVLTSQGTVEWYTPPDIIGRARAVLGGIDLDPASNDIAQSWIQARTYYTAADVWSGLARPWAGRVWLNPPFDATPIWVDRLSQAYTGGDVSAAILLVNSAPGYAWWERLTRQRHSVMLRERVRFVRADGTRGDQAKKGQTIVYFGRDLNLFVRVFGPLGRYLPPEEG